MESLDFVIDLTENLEKQNIDYFLIALRKNVKGSKADVFYRMSDEQSMTNMCHVLDTLKDDIEIGSGETYGPQKSSSKRSRKKQSPRREQPNNKNPSKQQKRPKRKKPKQTKKPPRKRGRSREDDNK